MATRNPECVICGDRFEDGRGLNGHLRFKHDLEGDELEEAQRKGMERGRRDSKPARPEHGGSAGRSIRDRELEVKGLLWENRKRKEELEEKRSGFDPFGLTSNSEEIEEKLEELEEQEERYRKELRRIADEREAGNVPEAPKPEESDRLQRGEQKEISDAIDQVDPEDG